MRSISNDKEIDKLSNKSVSMRKFLQNLQPSSDGKENLVGTGRTFQDIVTDGKTVRPEQAFEDIEKVKDKKERSIVEKVNPSLYKQLIIEDLTSTAGPSEKYWEVIAERRRKALEEVLDENRKLHSLVVTLEAENMACKELLEKTTDLVNTLKEMMNDEIHDNQELSNDMVDSGLSTPESYSSGKHIHKKIKISQSDSDSSSDS